MKTFHLEGYGTIHYIREYRRILDATLPVQRTGGKGYEIPLLAFLRWHLARSPPADPQAPRKNWVGFTCSSLATLCQQPSHHPVAMSCCYAWCLNMICDLKALMKLIGLYDVFHPSAKWKCPFCDVCSEYCCCLTPSGIRQLWCCHTANPLCAPRADNSLQPQCL